MFSRCAVGAHINRLWAWTPPEGTSTNELYHTQMAKAQYIAKEAGEECLQLSSCSACPTGRRLYIDALLSEDHLWLDHHLDLALRTMTQHGPHRALPTFCSVGEKLNALLDDAEAGDDTSAHVLATLEGRYGCSDRFNCLACPEGQNIFAGMLLDLTEHGLAGEWGQVLQGQ